MRHLRASCLKPEMKAASLVMSFSERTDLMVLSSFMDTGTKAFVPGSGECGNSHSEFTSGDGRCAELSFSYAS
ncbi:hypothetical protein VTN77DRAFT_3130 [Rasamsonia byssochlamydoides]|uniref:uncharacterized protein n=1 Tax=Rasamsonia byssochlamydoides TaxID=89139 RepID=UPI00374445DF